MARPRRCGRVPIFPATSASCICLSANSRTIATSGGCGRRCGSRSSSTWCCFCCFCWRRRSFRTTTLRCRRRRRRLDQSHFLELPPDAQKYLAKPPRTNIQSDKNRIAESKQPTPDKQTLEELERMRARGAPGAQRQRAREAAPQVAQQHRGSNPRLRSSRSRPQQSGQTMAQLQPQQPPAARKPNPFGGAQSAGSSIQDAIRAAANGRGAGQSGDYGEGLQPHSGVQGNAEILSDTEGVDFGPVHGARGRRGAPQLVRNHPGRGDASAQQDGEAGDRILHPQERQRGGSADRVPVGGHSARSGGAGRDHGIESVCAACRASTRRTGCSCASSSFIWGRTGSCSRVAESRGFGGIESVPSGVPTPLPYPFNGIS